MRGSKKLLFLFVIAVILFTSVPVEAKTKFKDVKGSTHYGKEVIKVADWGGLKGLIKAKKASPTKEISQKEFVRILTNLYGEKIVGKAGATSNKKVTQAWATKRLARVCKNKGVSMTWQGGDPKATITRAQACSYICKMVKCDPRMKPSK